jgi:hypothetical protein
MSQQETCSLCWAFNEAMRIAIKMGLGEVQQVYDDEQIARFRDHVMKVHNVHPQAFEVVIPV